MRTENILNLEYDAPNELVEKALLNVCTKNKRLSSFIKKVFKNNKHIQIYAFDDEGRKFDIECGDGFYEPCEFVIYNEDYICEDSGDNGWYPEDVHPLFDKYFIQFDWDCIKLDNGKIIILTDSGDYLAFQIFDMENLEDGAIDNIFIESVILDSYKKILNK
jgi:hypothetical protein